MESNYGTVIKNDDINLYVVTKKDILDMLWEKINAEIYSTMHFPKTHNKLYFYVHRRKFGESYTPNNKWRALLEIKGKGTLHFPILHYSFF